MAVQYLTAPQDAHAMDVNCVSWAPGTCGLLASCSDDQTVRIWQLGEAGGL